MFVRLIKYYVLVLLALQKTEDLRPAANHSNFCASVCVDNVPNIEHLTDQWPSTTKDRHRLGSRSHHTKAANSIDFYSSANSYSGSA